MFDHTFDSRKRNHEIERLEARIDYVSTAGLVRFGLGWTI